MTINPYDEPGFEQQTQQPAWEQQPTQPQVQPTATSTQGALVDIVNNSMDLWVFVDLPGFQPDEIHVRGDETTVMISAERPDELEEGRQVLLKERPKQIERTIQLPATVDISDADLHYEDGVCKIILPKASSDRYVELEFD
jgi:HSP20 family protein